MITFIRVKCHCNNQACFLLELHDAVTLNIVLNKSQLLFSELSRSEGLCAIFTMHCVAFKKILFGY